MTEDSPFYFKQLLTGVDVAKYDGSARSMANFIYLIGDRDTNLHALWDSGLIVRNGQSLLQYARTLNAAITPAEAENWVGGPNVWTNESRALVLDYGYPLLKDEHGRLTFRYLERGRTITEMQLMKGGVRLARLLNTILQPSIGSTP